MISVPVRVLVQLLPLYVIRRIQINESIIGKLREGPLDELRREESGSSEDRLLAALGEPG